MDARLRRLEDLNNPTREERERAAGKAVDDRLALEGTTREKVIAKYGSMAAWAYATMLGSGRQQVAAHADGLSAQERYMRMLNG